MRSINIFIAFLFIASANSALADSVQLSNQNKGNSFSSQKRKVIFSKGDDYKKIRKNLIDMGWKSNGNPYLDKSTPEVQYANKLNKLLGFFELQQCFSRGKALFSCDVNWTSTENKENPELLFSIVIDEVSKKSFIEEDVK